MRTILHAAHIGQAAPIRVVMLPAAYSRPEDFVREGFVEAVRARALAVDLVFAAPELPQVVDPRRPRRLPPDILPAPRPGGPRGLGGRGRPRRAHCPLSCFPPSTARRGW